MQKIVFISAIADYCNRQGTQIVDGRGDLLPCLSKSYLAFSNALVRDIKALYELQEIKKQAERQALNAATPTLEKKIKQEANKKAKAIVKTTTKAVSSALQKGKSKAEAKAAGVDARVAIQPKEQKLPEINEAATRLTAQLTRLLDPDYDPAKKLTEIIKHKRHLSDVSIQNLDTALKSIIEYAEGFRSRL